MKNLLFIHIIKTGGTKIRSLLDSRIYKNKFMFDNKVSAIIGNRILNTMHPHSSIKDYIDRYGQDILNKYKVFAIVRNPYTWNVSLYEYIKYRRNHHLNRYTKSFQYFIDYRRDIEDVNRITTFVEYNNEIVVDIYKYEEYDKVLSMVCKHSKVKYDNSYVNKGNINTETMYKQYYNKNILDKVNALHEKDFINFHYVIL